MYFENPCTFVWVISIVNSIFLIPFAGCHLSISSLCLLVPHLRLMSAFAWQVVQCRNVAHYGKVEELVRLVTELVPELLTPREKVQLLLRLRARVGCFQVSVVFILIAGCCINSHMGFITVLILCIVYRCNVSHSSFFQEVFPIHYGQEYEVTLHTLVWKFISRLDNLLPIPDIKQVSYRILFNLNHASVHLQTCSLCPYSDNKVSELLNHIRKEHLIQEPTGLFSAEPGEDVLQKVNSQMLKSKTNTCEYCGKIFEDVATLKTHIKTHIPIYHCDKCDKKYSSKAALIVHQRIHTGELPYLCLHCGRGLRSSNMLQLHVRTHTGDRRYTCHICGKTSVQHLARHMRMHRGEKNYLCSECGKTFLSSGELRLHTRYHTGERPYTCKHCGKSFTAKCHLMVHTRRHTGESPYRCSLCPKSFCTLRAQKKHMMIHSNQKSFQRLKCSKIFRHEETFKMHKLATATVQCSSRNLAKFDYGDQTCTVGDVRGRDVSVFGGGPKNTEGAGRCDPQRENISGGLGPDGRPRIQKDIEAVSGEAEKAQKRLSVHQGQPWPR
uniref:C2H2-type domain-containing protein n=1 Tax=Amphiprion percula TaxID=161767 RepID=A0A3P8TPJ7_AMPPE